MLPPCSACLTRVKSIKNQHADARAAEPRAGEARRKAEGNRSRDRRRSRGSAFLVLVVYGVGFVFAAIAAGLSEALSLWLSLLIVAVMLFLLRGARRVPGNALRPQGLAPDADAGHRGGRHARSKHCRAMSEKRGAEEIRRGDRRRATAPRRGSQSAAWPRSVRSCRLSRPGSPSWRS